MIDSPDIQFQQTLPQPVHRSPPSRHPGQPQSEPDSNLNSGVAAVAEHGLLERRYAIARHYNKHGVCVFDRHQRLVLSNEQYATIYGLAPSDIRVGMSLREILKLRIEKGIYGSNGAAAYEREWLRSVTRRRTRIQDLIDGRCILVVQQPTTDGHWIATHEDITERLQMEAQVSFLATRDSLTGLANRSALMARLNDELPKMHPSARACIMLLDLDHFKPVNDTYGHDVGDEVLKIAAARLRCQARDTDTVARLGGDEFVLFQSPLCDKTKIANRAAAIVFALAEPFRTSVGQVSVGASVGVVISGPSNATADKLLKSADLALYAAKESGRGTYHINDLESPTSPSRRIHSENSQMNSMPMNRALNHRPRDNDFGQRAGLSIQRPSDRSSGSMPNRITENEADRRLDERVHTSFRANVFCHDRYQTIMVQNVSCGGLMMANAFGLATGDSVIVTTLSGRCYKGRVAWSVSPYTGVKFDTRISPDDPLFQAGHVRPHKR